MPRGSNGAYQLPAGSQAQPNTVIESAMFNATILDIQQELNAVRPISSGGTGQSTLAAVKLAFGITALENIVGTGNINANNITSGILAPARLSGTYNIGITGNAATATTAGNATNLGGQPATNYARTDIDEVFSGRVNINRLDDDEQFRIGQNRNGDNFMSFYRDGVRRGFLQTRSTGISIGSEASVTAPDYILDLLDDGRLTWRGQQVITTTEGAINASNILNGTVPSARLSGTYGISITGNAATATTADGLSTTLSDFHRNASNLNAGTVPSARLSGTYNISVTSSAQLNGIASTNYARTDIDESFNGHVNVSRLDDDEQLRVGVGRSGNNYIGIYRNDGVGNPRKGLMQCIGDGIFRIGLDNNDGSFEVLDLREDGTLRWNDQVIFHDGNDGAGSGLDADLLDGVQGSNYLRSDINDTKLGFLSIQRSDLDEQLRIGQGRVGDSFMALYRENTRRGVLQVRADRTRLSIERSTDSFDMALQLLEDGRLFWVSDEVWHDGNAVHNIVQNHYTGTQNYGASTDRHISVLNTTLNKRHANTAVWVQARISLERSQDGVLYVRRGVTEVGSGGPDSGSRHHGMVPIPHDDDQNSTMQTIVVNFLDIFTDTGNQQYQFWVRGSNATMSINRTLGDVDSTSYERASSQIILQEVYIS